MLSQQSESFFYSCEVRVREYNSSNCYMFSLYEKAILRTIALLIEE